MVDATPLRMKSEWYNNQIDHSKSLLIKTLSVADCLNSNSKESFAKRVIR
jgi:hypothetical protein